MKEQNTNYAYKLKYLENPTFDKVRDLAVQFMYELPQQLQTELYEALNRGVDILDSEPQMVTYLYSFGKMHQAKLQYAFDKLPSEFLHQDKINIIDYGCGQALGTMCYADFLRENGCEQKIKTITLIEPSEMCLKRAALHASVFFPNAQIKTVCKTFDDLDADDICCDEDTPTLHILSNVLDMLDFDLNSFSNLLNECLDGYNQFVCVGPYFCYSVKDDRIEYFCSLLNGDENYSIYFDKYEFNEDKPWTAHILCFSANTIKGISTITYNNSNYIEDKYGVIYSQDGKKILKCLNTKLKSYSIKEGTTYICDEAFSKCQMLNKITIPNSTSNFGNNVFNFSYLEELHITNKQIILLSYSESNKYSFVEIKKNTYRKAHLTISFYDALYLFGHIKITNDPFHKNLAIGFFKNNILFSIDNSIHEDLIKSLDSELIFCQFNELTHLQKWHLTKKEKVITGKNNNDIIQILLNKDLKYKNYRSIGHLVPDISKIDLRCEEFINSLKTKPITYIKPDTNKYNSPIPKEPEGCYIATMVYGYYDHPKVLVLRSFRDKYLLKNKLGKLFVKLYYWISPKLVILFNDRQFVNKIIRNIIDSFVGNLIKHGY